MSGIRGAVQTEADVLKALSKSPFNRLAKKNTGHVMELKDQLSSSNGLSLALVGKLTRKLKRLQVIKAELDEIEKELSVLYEKTGYQITTIPGVGIVIACRIIAEIKDISRFQSASKLARYAGLAPKEFSSGKSRLYQKTKSGDRKLNLAFYQMALSQIGRMGSPEAKEYWEKKIAEGKSKMQALGCLKRKMVNTVFAMMRDKSAYQPNKNEEHSIDKSLTLIAAV